MNYDFIKKTVQIYSFNQNIAMKLSFFSNTLIELHFQPKNKKYILLALLTYIS